MTKGGRPRKGERERRIDHLNVRLTVVERAHLDAEARRLGIPVSRYVRRLINRRRPIERRNIAACSPATVSALNRIGNNLNQLTRQANTKGDLAPVSHHLGNLLAKLETAINVLLDRQS